MNHTVRIHLVIKVDGEKVGHADKWFDLPFAPVPGQVISKDGAKHMLEPLEYIHEDNVHYCQRGHAVESITDAVEVTRRLTEQGFSSKLTTAEKPDES